MKPHRTNVYKEFLLKFWYGTPIGKVVFPIWASCKPLLAANRSDQRIIRFLQLCARWKSGALEKNWQSPAGILHPTAPASYQSILFNTNSWKTIFTFSSSHCVWSFVLIKTHLDHQWGPPWWFDALKSVPVKHLGHFRNALKWRFWGEWINSDNLLTPSSSLRTKSIGCHCVLYNTE